jgi:plasmid stabilization system protein ParE
VKVRFTPSARQHFLDAIAYIATDKPKAARRFRVRCHRTLKRLEQFPNSGHKIPEFPELPQRQVIEAPLRFFYRVDGKIVWIVAVWHDKQVPGAPQ